MTGKPARVLVVEDHAALGRALTFALDAEEDLEVVGLAPTLSSAFELIPATRPDVVLMDVNLPDGDGIDATARVVEIHPEAAVLIMTAHADQRAVKRAADAGASGLVLKDVRIDRVLAAVRAVIAGETVFDPALPAG